MGARIPPNERPRRGGVKCEFCGRTVPSVQSLRSHQHSLHSSELKEKNKQKPVAIKSSRVQKPELRGTRIVLKKGKAKIVTKVNNSAIVKKSKIVKKEIKIDKEKPKTEKEKLKTEKETPKTDKEVSKPAKEKPKPEKDKPKAEKEKSKSPVMEGVVNIKPNNLRRTEFKCPKCEKLFPVLFSATKHIQKRHCVNERDEPVSPDSSYLIKPIALQLCIYCNDKFTSPHDCPNRPAFGVAGSYNCMGCQQRFTSNKLFDIHVANVHGDRSENMFFPSEEEFTAWKNEMESQTDCNYIIIGQYNSKKVYRCSHLSDDSTDDAVFFCPSMIVASEYPKAIQVNFYLTHYGHDYKEYELLDQYKSYSITDVLQQTCDGTEMSSDENDLYLQFKTLMENIVLDAAKINIDTLKILIGKALDMTSILTQYDEDEDVMTTVNTSTLLLNTIKKEDQITKALEGLRSSQRNKRGIEENGTGDKRLRTEGKKRSMFSLSDDKDSNKILKELEDNTTKTGKCNKSPSLDIENVKNSDQKIQSPTSFNDSYKDFISQNSQKPIVKKRNVVKTKIGQFKPNSPKKEKHNNSFGKAKEPEYEVRERDNDCNILVLKI